MNCLTARRALCALDAAPDTASAAAAMAHARACPHCRRLGLRFADAILMAAGDELPCAECQVHLDRVALGGAPAQGWARREPELAARVQAHLLGCPDCGAELALLRGMLTADLTAAEGPMPARFDTRFAEEAAPVRPRQGRPRRRALSLPLWLRGILGRFRELPGAWQGSPRVSRAALAALTAVVVFALARLVLQDPGLRGALEKIVPFIPPAATADLDALRAEATATAAARASQTAAATAAGMAAATTSPRLPSPTPSATPAVTQSPAAESETRDKEERERARSGTAPPTPPLAATPAEGGSGAAYPPPEDPTPNPYPGGEPGGGPGDDPAYPPPGPGVPPEPVDPTPEP